MSVDRRLTFYAWADTSLKHPFDRLAAAASVKGLGKGDIVLDHGDEELTAVQIISVGSESTPTRLLLHALHGPGSRPSEYEPGFGTRTIQIGEGRFSAFTGHVVIWDDKVAAIDGHANSPGFGRLSVYFRKQAGQRVAFRPLYNQDTAERLKDLDGIRGVDFAIHESNKVIQAEKRGMLRSLLPRKKFPSIRVAVGMSRKEPRESYVDDAVEEEIFGLADSAEQFFDRLVVRGLSKTLRTETGQKKSITINLLSERLHVTETLPSDAADPSLPERKRVFSRLIAARKGFDATGDLTRAVEARLSLDED